MRNHDKGTLLDMDAIADVNDCECCARAVKSRAVYVARQVRLLVTQRHSLPRTL